MPYKCQNLGKLKKKIEQIKLKTQSYHNGKLFKKDD